MAEQVCGYDASGHYPNIKLSIELITPETAANMLKFNTHNRKPKRSALRQEMLDGGWMLNGATIVFADDGTLLDGQNRLLQCIASNTPITTVVVRGIDKNAQITMDCGRKRSLNDYIALAGYEDTNNLSTIAYNLYRCYKNGLQGVLYKNANEGGGSIRSVFAFFLEHDEECIFLKRQAAKITKRYKGIPAGPLACFIREFYKSSEEDAEYFIEQLISNSTELQPINMLRERLIENSCSMQHNRMTTRQVLALIVKTWNAYMTGSELKILRFREGGKAPEEFPTVYKEVA